MGAALLAGCSNNGGSSVAPSASTGMSGFGHIGKTVIYHGLLVTAAHLSLGVRGPISPDRKRHKKKRAYQYISNFDSSTLDEFNYPKSDASIGTISGVTDAQGECTNVLFGVGKKTFGSRLRAPTKLTSSMSAAAPNQRLEHHGRRAGGMRHRPVDRHPCWNDH